MNKRNRNWHTFNEYYFDSVDTPEKAYWLGFITADGCVSSVKHHYRVDIKLMESDAGHLEKLRSAVSAEGTVRFSPRRGVAGPAAALWLSSRHFVESLAALGVGPRKSLTVKPWDGPAGLMPHYWRGMFDGDGCISRSSVRKTWLVSLCGSKACVDAFAEWGSGVCGSDARARFVSNIWYWNVSGVAMPQALIRELYRDAAVYLDRKHDLARQLLAQPILSRSWRGQECAEADCGKEATVMGMCQTHYRRNWFEQAEGSECTVDGCHEKQLSCGYCNKHYQRFHKHGDPTRADRGREGSRRYALNDTLFDEIDTSEKAYWLGFIAATGSVVRSAKTFQLRMELRMRDEDYLIRLRDALGSAKPLRYRTGVRTGELATVHFDSWRLVDALERHGVTTRNGMTVTPWNGPAGLMPCYQQGLADGRLRSLRPGRSAGACAA